MKKLVVLRHGESQWNRENRFTGWTDVGLTDQGIREAVKAGKTLQENGYTFDMAFTSLLSRSVKTLWLVLEEMDLMWVPVRSDWRLNERHYGALQGLNKAETTEKYGVEQVRLWRRSYTVHPPAITVTDARYPGKDRRYDHVPREDLPLTESLRDAEKRCLSHWKEAIAPVVKRGRRVLIVAHGNSLRALVKYLDGISDKGIADLEIPTGIPLVYELNEDLCPVSRKYLKSPLRCKA